MNLKTKLSACFAALSLIIILVLSTFSYQALQDRTISSLNTELTTAAHATNKIIGDGRHDHLDKAGSNYDDISRNLTSFTQASDLDWAYSTVMKNGRVYYTYINQTDDEARSGRYQNWYLEEYKIVPKMLHKAFATQQVQFEEYQGEYGRYRSIFVPFRTQAGDTYVIGVDVSLSEVDAMIEGELKLVCITAVIVMALALIVARLFANRLVAPINALNAVLLNIANGDWNLTQQVPVTSKDEVGTMSQSFNTFMVALRERLLEINQSTDSVAAVSTQLDSLIQAVTERSVEQAENVGNSATAIEELATSSQSISEVVTLANQKMTHFEQHTQDTVGAINHAVTGMQSVQLETNTVAEKLHQLDGRANDINSIVEVIKDIADQTNLLALNAAIEAARAGEQGRGFAVVADEVRQLSERTAKATVEIGSMINTIQSDTSGATDTMQSAVGQVDNCVQHADQANESLNGFRTEITSVTEGMEEITESVKEQAFAAEHLSSNVAALSSSADENRLSTQEAQQGVEELKRRATELRKVVQLFTL
ncbi:methyl-accepting chemotaxis protein [Photobacterium alginatilyticum]|uniref:Methyl-accepting chemotaxis protein n=1 Tax=Photobacterium alginatilyticum TaxID=1775171 RepID=A0ABW9YN02_9GAMM|nr:methyl-accepting chemotaxis protein [Photobacterium alginatilyticum]NBI55186.1 methyl-accepting chemotaxis protein [Photobacterium alginatilyticum]